MGRKSESGITPAGVQVRGGSIRLRFTLTDGTREQRTLCIPGTKEPLPPTPKNIEHAGKLIREINDRIRHRVFEIAHYFESETKGGNETTVSDQLDTLLGASSVEHSTMAGYTSAARFWKSSAVGARSLKALRVSEIKTVLAKATQKGKTLANYLSVLREALALAVADRLISENPAGEIVQKKGPKEEPDPFDADERERIIEHLHAKHPGQVANIVEFWFWTGLRTSELAGLEWKSVDRRKGEVLIHEALVRGRHKDTTKTDRNRRFKLNSRALEALKAQEAHTLLAAVHVFQDPRYGTPWTEERAFRRSFWTPTLKALGIRYRRPYQMRHTYASQLLMSGVRPAYCAKVLGHSVQVFHSTYARWIDGEADAAELARLEEAISSSKPAKSRDGT